MLSSQMCLLVEYEMKFFCTSFHDTDVLCTLSFYAHLKRKECGKSYSSIPCGHTRGHRRSLSPTKFKIISLTRTPGTYIQVMRSADKKGFTRKDLAIGLAKQYQKFFKNRAKYKVWVKDISCIGINAISYKSRYMCWVWT